MVSILFNALFLQDRYTSIRSPTHNALHSPTSSRSNLNTECRILVIFVLNKKIWNFTPPGVLSFFPCGVKYQYFLTVLYRSCKFQYRDTTTVDGPQIKKASKIGEASSSLTLIACIVNHSMWRYSANRICALCYELWFESDTEERRGKRQRSEESNSEKTEFLIKTGPSCVLPTDGSKSVWLIPDMPVTIKSSSVTRHYSHVQSKAFSLKSETDWLRK